MITEPIETIKAIDTCVENPIEYFMRVLVSSFDQDDKSLGIFNLGFLLDPVDLKYRAKTYDMALYLPNASNTSLSTALEAAGPLPYFVSTNYICTYCWS